MIPQYAGLSPADVSRIPQGLIADVGFLGACAIMIGQQKDNQTGLTTAATIWITAAIGITVGIGFETTAALSTLFTLAILALMPKFVSKPNS